MDYWRPALYESSWSVFKEIWYCTPLCFVFSYWFLLCVHHCSLYVMAHCPSLYTRRSSHSKTFIYKSVLGFLPTYLCLYMCRNLSPYDLTPRTSYRGRSQESEVKSQESVTGQKDLKRKRTINNMLMLIVCFPSKNTAWRIIIATTSLNQKFSLCKCVSAKVLDMWKISLTCCKITLTSFSMLWSDK